MTQEDKREAFEKEQEYRANIRKASQSMQREKLAEFADKIAALAKEAPKVTDPHLHGSLDQALRVLESAEAWLRGDESTND